MYEITLQARAKINISLDVLGKREDGYHDVSMIMQTVGLHDKVYLKKTQKKGIHLNVNLKWLPTDEKNLCYKAAKLLMEAKDIKQGIYIDLHKRIPIAAGLAGGSSDAAAVLIGMNKLFGLGLTKKELAVYGKEIGADVPYCILQGTALAEGIGEELTPLPPFPKCYVVLAKPDIKVSTPWVYNNLDVNSIKKHPKTEELIDRIKRKDLTAIAEGLCNVLEDVTIKAYPVIEDIKEQLMQDGALGAMMSGSGPTVFALFDDKDKASQAVARLREKELAKHIFMSHIYHPIDKGLYRRGGSKC